MQYAARLTTLPSPKRIAAPLAALALGAAIATGAYALIDNDSVVQEPAKVIVVDTPATGEGVSAKNEAATAAAVGVASLSDASAVKDESAAASAVGSGSSDIELRGSKASGTGSSSDDAASAARTDPHGTASALRSP